MTARRIRTLLLYADAQGRTLSYHQGWPKAFARHSGFDCTAVNLGDRRVRARLLAHVTARRRRRFDAVVLLHSVLSNASYLEGRLATAIAALPQPKAYFLSNEFKMMPQRMAFCDRLGVTLLVTQSMDPSVWELYRERLPKTRVVGIPNAGLDEDLFPAGPPPELRPIDIGYRADPGPGYLGHNERSELAERFLEHPSARHLALDISLAAEDRLTPPEWSAFLARCRAQLGCEAGADFLELDDATRLRAIGAPGAPEPDGRAPVSGRVLSARIVEAAATGTVQLLIEGSYGGFFNAGEHYIPLRKDFSNIDEALEHLGSPALCRPLVRAAAEVARGELTYPRLVGRFRDELIGQLS